MEKVKVKVIEKDALANLKKKKNALIKMMLISSGIDLAMTIPEAATMFQTLGGSIIVEEIVESVISNTIGNMEEYGVKISWLDRAKGFIPIPGITSLTLKCWKELKKVNQQIDEIS